MDQTRIKKIQNEGVNAVLKRIEAISCNKFVNTVIKPLLWMIAALSVSETEAIMGVTPFGIALVCVAPGFVNASATLCGAVLGTAAMGSYGIWQIFICVGVYLLRLVISVVENRKSLKLERSFNESTALRVLSAAIASICAGAVTVLYGSNMYLDIFAAVIGFALYPAFTYSIILLMSKKDTTSARMAGLCGVAYAVTLTLYSWTLPFNAGAVFALAATLIVTYTNGAISGASLGIFCGMAMEAYYAPLYPIAAFTAGLVGKYSHSAAVISATAAGLCWALRTGGFNTMSDLLPEMLFTAAVLAPIANLGIFPKRQLFQKPRDICPPSDSREKELEGKLGKLSLSLEDISDLLTQVSDKVQRPTREEAVRICSSARARYCAGCVHNEICTGIEKKETDNFFLSLSRRLAETGSAGAGIVPKRLASRCHNIDKILDLTNTSAKITGKLAAENCRTRLFASDYKAIASLLRQSTTPETEIWERDTDKELELRSHFSQLGVDFSGVSVYGRRCRKIYYRGIGLPNAAGENDIRIHSEKIVGSRLSSPDFTIDGSTVSAYLHSVPRFEMESGRYSSAGNRDNFSGDTVSSFKNDEGYYYSLVSDGMGSGREAALTSGISAVFLEKLLMAGAPMKSSLEMLNSFICGGDGECFTTVDLMEADLYTGKASFIKSGAAPSFILRGGKVFRLHSKTVPIGIIRALDAERISFDVEDGDMIVMMSDGVTGSYEACPWLYELLESNKLSTLSPKDAAGIIGEAAEKFTEKEDDITVAVIKVNRV